MEKTRQITFDESQLFHLPVIQWKNRLSPKLTVYHIESSGK